MVLGVGKGVLFREVSILSSGSTVVSLTHPTHTPLVYTPIRTSIELAYTQSCLHALPQTVVTAESASELVQNITSALGSTNEEDQTTDNLNLVTNVLEDVVGLLNQGNFTIDEDVRNKIIYDQFCELFS